MNNKRASFENILKLRVGDTILNISATTSAADDDNDNDNDADDDDDDNDDDYFIIIYHWGSILFFSSLLRIRNSKIMPVE